MNPPLIPSEALEGLMKKAFEEQTVDVGLFWDALLNSHLVLPMAPSEAVGTLPDLPDDGEKQIPILLGQDVDGKYVIWIFTSTFALTEYTEQDLRFVSMPARELFQSIRESTHEIVLIGPAGLTLNLHPELVASLAEGKVPDQPAEEIRTIPKDTAVFVGKPTDEVAALEARFRTLFSNLPDVLEACFIQISDDAGSRLLLGLRLVDQSQENFKRIAGVIAKAAEGVLEKGKTMDITLLNKSLKDAFEKWGKPFFKR